MLNETSDLYRLGILLMEIISGRNPVDYSRPPGEVNLVDWIKTMVTSRNAEGVLDPKIAEKPSSSCFALCGPKCSEEAKDGACGTHA
ncbi:Non-specific serine/threonine protein kinase [Bertholletia excelsa]